MKFKFTTMYSLPTGWYIFDIQVVVVENIIIATHIMCQASFFLDLKSLTTKQTNNNNNNNIKAIGDILQN
jgi:hypothetical protein